MYNYYNAMENDIKNYIEENIDLSDYTREALEEELNDDLWICDSVTGNGSGSYTFCRATAKEYVADNMDLCVDALKEFCVEPETIAEKFLTEDWEYFDVTIRCYLLSECICSVLDEYEEELFGNDEL